MGRPIVAARPCGAAGVALTAYGITRLV